MNDLMCFEGCSVSVIQIDGQPLFELYSTGAALGYVKSNGYSQYARKDRINKVCENAEIIPCVHSGHTYLTESQLYDFMLEARTDKCRAFRKWVTNEVLPAIRQDGSYSTAAQTMQRSQDKSIIIQHKFLGQPVLTFNEIEAVSGIPFYFARDYTLKYGRRGFDYVILRGDDLIEYKSSNIIDKNVNALTVVFKPFIHEVYEHYRSRIVAQEQKQLSTKQQPTKQSKPRQTKKLTPQELADYVTSMPQSKREKYVGALVLALIESCK